MQFLRSHRVIVQQVSDRVLMRLDPPIELVAKMSFNGTTGLVEQDAPLPMLRILPRREADSGKALLHLHGGAYCSGGLLQCRMLISPICAASQVSAFTFSYRLTPKHPYPAQLEDALKAYQYVRSLGYGPKDIAFVGESAGGNLALALAQSLRDLGQELPAALCLLSPWTDLAQKGDSYRTLQDEDATLNAAELLEDALVFAGGVREKLDDPLLSPIYADFTDFPPTQIHCGTSEILLSDSENLEKAMQRYHVPVQLIRWEGMCHVFQVYGFEESKQSNQAAGAFLKKHLMGRTTWADKPQAAADECIIG